MYLKDFMKLQLKIRLIIQKQIKRNAIKITVFYSIEIEITKIIETSLSLTKQQCQIDTKPIFMNFRVRYENTFLT